MFIEKEEILIHQNFSILCYLWLLMISVFLKFNIDHFFKIGSMLIQ